MRQEPMRSDNYFIRICAVLSMTTPGRSRFFLLFTDYHRRRRCVYFPNKSEVDDDFKEYTGILQSETIRKWWRIHMPLFQELAIKQKGFVLNPLHPRHQSKMVYLKGPIWPSLKHVGVFCTQKTCLLTLGKSSRQRESYQQQHLVFNPFPIMVSWKTEFVTPTDFWIHFFFIHTPKAKRCMLE